MWKNQRDHDNHANQEKHHCHLIFSQGKHLKAYFICISLVSETKILKAAQDFQQMASSTADAGNDDTPFVSSLVTCCIFL